MTAFLYKIPSKYYYRCTNLFDHICRFMTNKEIIFCRQYHNVKIDQLQIIPNQVDNFFQNFIHFFRNSSRYQKNYTLNSHDGKEVEAENIFKCIEEV